MAIIHILGASGSGTSTLGRYLHKRFDYLHLDIDDYYWLPSDPPFTHKRPEEERIRLLKNNIESSDKVVLSGAFCGWGDVFIPRFNLVVRLTVPTETRLRRLKEREYAKFGQRIQAGGDMFEGHRKFIQWAAEYDTGDTEMRSKTQHDEWMSGIPCRKITLDGNMTSEEMAAVIADNCTL